MELNNFEIKEKIELLQNKAQKIASTFIYNPDEMEKVRQEIFKLQEKCNHEYKNDKCIYCKKIRGKNVN